MAYNPKDPMLVCATIAAKNLIEYVTYKKGYKPILTKAGRSILRQSFYFHHNESMTIRSVERDEDE
jgi:hypothetical protein